MKKTLAHILARIMLATSCITFVACNKKDTLTVGVCQLVQHAALDQATQGFIDALKAELGDKIEIDVQNAAGDTNVCNTIIGNFVSKGVDLIMANATPALQAAYNATTTIPIVIKLLRTDFFITLLPPDSIRLSLGYFCQAVP